MPGPDSGLGKAAENVIKIWLNRPESGFSFDRLPDQMTGFFGSSNICDFICFKSPYQYYIESKATWEDRFDFSMLSQNQEEGLINKSKIDNVYGWVIVLFASHKRAFILDINDIVYMRDIKNKKSLNINKIDKWGIPYFEIPTIENNRKRYLDYVVNINDAYVLDIARANLEGKHSETKE